MNYDELPIAVTDALKRACPDNVRMFHAQLMQLLLCYKQGMSVDELVHLAESQPTMEQLFCDANKDQQDEQLRSNIAFFYGMRNDQCQHRVDAYVTWAMTGRMDISANDAQPSEERAAMCGLLRSQLQEDYPQDATVRYYALLMMAHLHSITDEVNARGVRYPSDYDLLEHFQEKGCNAMSVYIDLMDWWKRMSQLEFESRQRVNQLGEQELAFCQDDERMKMLMGIAREQLQRINPAMYTNFLRFVAQGNLTRHDIRSAWERSQKHEDLFAHLILKDMKQLHDHMPSKMCHRMARQLAQTYALRWNMYNWTRADSPELAAEAAKASMSPLDAARAFFLRVWSHAEKRFYEPEFVAAMRERPELLDKHLNMGRAFLMTSLMARLPKATGLLYKMLYDKYAQTKKDPEVRSVWRIIHCLLELEQSPLVVGRELQPDTQEALEKEREGVLEWNAEQRMINLAKALMIAVLLCPAEELRDVVQRTHYQEWTDRRNAYIRDVVQTATQREAENLSAGK